MWIVPEFMKFGNEAGGGSARCGGFAATKPKARGFKFGFGRQDRDFIVGLGDKPSRIHETAPRRPALSRPIHIIRRNALLKT
jgi:hypothetical protein